MTLRSRVAGSLLLLRRSLLERTDAGQGLVEYALILFCVAIVVVAIVGVFGVAVADMFSRVTSAVP